MKIAVLLGGGTRFDVCSFDHIAWCARYLAERGHKVTAVDYKYLPADAKTEQHAGVTVIRLTVCGLDQGKLRKLLFVKPLSPGRILERILWALSLVRYMSGKQFDVVYCGYSLANLILIFLFRSMRKKLVAHSMMLLEEDRCSWADKQRLALETFVGRRIGMVVAENIVAERCLLKADMGNNKVMTIEPGVDTAFWIPDMHGEQIRESYNLGNKMVILFQARVVPRKGVEYLIKAADILVHERGHQNLAFLIVGPPTEATIPTREETLYVGQLSNLVQSFDLSEVVKLAIGWQPIEKLRQFYAAADIYVLPTLVDMAPHSIKQAMAVGMPVVSTRIGWVHTLIEEGENGFLVEPHQERPLASALEKLITDGELRERMSLKNRQKAEKLWSMEEEARKWEALFLRIAQSH